MESKKTLSTIQNMPTIIAVMLLLLLLFLGR